MNTRAAHISTGMSAWEQLKAEKRCRRLTQLVVGLAGYGTSLSFLVESELGASSWSVLAEGVGDHTGLSFGMATNLLPFAVIAPRSTSVIPNWCSVAMRYPTPVR